MGELKLKENYLRPHAEREIEEEIRVCDAQLGTRDQLEQVVDRRKVMQRKRHLERDLETQKPPDLSGVELDVLNKEQKNLAESISSEMPTRDMMMRNPSGAVGYNIGFEKKHKKDILLWKRNQVLLNRGSEDPDIANAERLRPDADSLLSFAGAQIPRKAEYSMPSPQFSAKYDEINWQEKVGELESRISSVEALEKQLKDAIRSAKPARKSRPLTEKQLAAHQKMRDAANEKRALKETEEASTE